MNLKVIGTGSQGNTYLLYNKEEVLLIECGVTIKKIKEALNFDFSKVIGCIISHEHLDHCKAVKDILSAGIKVYASHGTLEVTRVLEHHKTHPIQSKKIYQIGNFKIIPFDVRHDAKEPLGFLIQHPECGVVCFLTDTFYSPYKFNGLNNLIIEANFCEDIIDQKLKFDKKFLRDRILKSHLSIQKCIDLLNVNDLSAVNQIVLIHLSDSNSNEIEFQKKVQEATGKNTIVAYNGLDIPFNKTPF